MSIGTGLYHYMTIRLFTGTDAEQNLMAAQRDYAKKEAFQHTE